MTENTTKPAKSGAGSLIGVLIALAILGFYGYTVVAETPLDAQQHNLLKVLVALAAGILSFFVPGAMSIEDTSKSRTLSAAGGFAVFALVLFVLFDATEESTAPVAQDQSPHQSGMVPAVTTTYTFETYCDECCPYGPQDCPSYAIYTDSNAQTARDFVLRVCEGNGGMPARCQANLQQLN